MPKKRDDITSIEDLESLEHEETDEDFDFSEESEEFEENDINFSDEGTLDVSESLDEDFEGDSFDESTDFETEDETVIVDQLKEPEKYSPPVENEESLEMQDLTKSLNDAMEAHVPTHIPMENIPSFSLRVWNIDDVDTQRDVLRLLREFEVMTEDNEELYHQSVARGEIIVTRIGEYLGIGLAHKLRHLQLDYKLGLTEDILGIEVDPIERGPVNSTTMAQNKTFSYEE